MKFQQKGIRCLKCGDEIYSNYRHDFRNCKCGSCFIDGGFDYMRVGFGRREDYEHISRPLEEAARELSRSKTESEIRRITEQLAAKIDAAAKPERK